MDRRTFGKACTALVGSGLIWDRPISAFRDHEVPGAPAFRQDTDDNRQAGESSDSEFRKAIKFNMVDLEADLLAKFRLLKELGFDGVELDCPNDFKSEDVVAAVEDTGLVVHGVVSVDHWKKTFSHADEAVRAEAVEALETALRCCKKYGGDSVQLVPGVCNKDATYEQAWERSIVEIKKVIPLAEELEIDILVENVWNNFLTDPEEMARYIAQFDSPRIGFYFDVGNSVRYAPPIKWIDVLSKHIRKLDIKEYDRKLGEEKGWYEGFKVELQEGTCNWPAVIKKLSEKGFSGWGTAEVPGGDRQRLTDISGQMTEILVVNG